MSDAHELALRRRLKVDLSLLKRLGLEGSVVRNVRHPLGLLVKLAEEELVEPGRVHAHLPLYTPPISTVLRLLEASEEVGYEVTASVEVIAEDDGRVEEVREVVDRVEPVILGLPGVLTLSDRVFELASERAPLFLDLGWALHPHRAVPSVDLTTVPTLAALRAVESVSGEDAFERVVAVARLGHGLTVDRGKVRGSGGGGLKLVDVTDVLRALSVVLDLARYPVAPALGPTVRRELERLLDGFDGPEREDLTEAARAFELLSNLTPGQTEEDVKIPEHPSIIREVLEDRLRDLVE
ncbi:hypothetical protein [Methanopyrus kandleri]|uniref:Uncharacterized protein specific for M.kandleri, MK-23 family n=2 Tax=Methanopyrus kandleri TaxID=2320 RepID=Q8TWA5_METKA|nr:hypothetical protein [Methanopyrus kandleri]AAM02344.1 Uncharacterized protein specific for M.kandleri, MK-23 family [Methanopyrus kandleri AV19]HII69766.1 hypothetical protein [Methanopyrus kandleri]